MRRSLVVTDEAARHPFRMSLPPHVRRGVEQVDVPRSRGITAQDVKEFLMAYCACFICVSAFVS